MKTTSTIHFHKCSKQNVAYLHGHVAHILTYKQKKGPGAQQSSGLRSVGVSGVWKQELLEGLGKRFGGVSG
jgi:hypothetical protein